MKKILTSCGGEIPANAFAAVTPLTSGSKRRGGPLLFAVLMVALAGCSKPPSPSPRVYASADEAGNALQAAVKAGDLNSVQAILGPTSREVLASGDAVQDRNVADAFAAAYGVMHRWRRMPDDAQMLLIGSDNFPFPIPLRKNSAGQWFFDTPAGRDEILNRRIGRNELAIIEACAAIVDAQQEYFSQSHDGATAQQYAAQFISDPGKQNGLSWKSQQGEDQGPLGPLLAMASSEGYQPKSGVRTAFHGYYFHMLKAQGANAPGGARDYSKDGKMTDGFAFVAYPAEYGNSGVMTFIVNQDGVLLQKDLGKSTAEIAAAMTEFNPDTSWKPVDDEDQ
jgi:Protein of unknown function (DUF2950)